MLLADCTTKGPQRGSLKATRSQNGNHPVRVRFCGSTGNVSRRTALSFVKIDSSSRFVAGAGKSVLWYVSLPLFPS